MIRRKAVLWIFLVCLLCPPQILEAGSEGRLSRSLAQVTSGIKTPEELVRFMKQQFKATDDERLSGHIDYWQSPEELWSQKAGDCEDFALFAQSRLKEEGFPSWVVSLYGPSGYAHTIAIFKEGGRYHVINEWRLHRYEATSLEEALTYVYPYWTWAGIAEKRGTRGWLRFYIQNPSPQELPFQNPFTDFSTG